MIDLDFDPATTTVDAFEAGLDRLRAAYYGPRCVRLEKRIAEQDAQIAELKRLHGEACQRAAEADERAKKAEAATVVAPKRGRK